jgi:hypothetical protein
MANHLQLGNFIVLTKGRLIHLVSLQGNPMAGKGQRLSALLSGELCSIVLESSLLCRLHL